MVGTVSKWKSLLQHVASVVTFGLVEFQKYAPSALVLAQTLFPEYAGAEKAIQQRLVNVTGLIQNSIVTVEAKYASATASNETNSAKLADVLALVGPEAVDTLQAAGVTGGLDRVTAIVNAGVAVLHAMPAPAGT